MITWQRTGSQKKMQPDDAAAASAYKTSFSLPPVQSDSQGHVGKITEEISSNKDPEVSFLPKVRGGVHLQLASAGAGELQKGKFLERLDGPESAQKFASETSAASILEIFARSVDHHLSVDKMWSELKADALRRLKPIIIHSLRLRQGASPSAQQCLDIYKMPTAIDQYTGKPIPLSQVLREVTKRMYTSRGAMSAINVAMRHVARLSQMKAEMMLERKDPYNFMTTSDHQDWYFPQIKQQSSSVRPIRTADSKRRSFHVKRIETGDKKKQLPCYLTGSGNLVSASLEEFEGAVVYCRPSNQSKLEVEEEVSITKDDSSSVFLTDIVCPASARTVSDGRGTSLLPISAMGTASTDTDGDMINRRPTAASKTLTVPALALAGRTTTRNTNRTLHVLAGTTGRILTAPATNGTTGSRPITRHTLTDGITTTTNAGRMTTSSSTRTTTEPMTSSRVSTWEPLNTTALLEHTTVSLIPVTRPGHLAHGQYHMWRPQSCHTPLIQQ